MEKNSFEGGGFITFLYQMPISSFMSVFLFVKISEKMGVYLSTKVCMANWRKYQTYHRNDKCQAGLPWFKPKVKEEFGHVLRKPPWERNRAAVRASEILWLSSWCPLTDWQRWAGGSQCISVLVVVGSTSSYQFCTTYWATCRSHSVAYMSILNFCYIAVPSIAA